MSNQAPDGSLPNDAAQGSGPGGSFGNYGKGGRVPTTSPKAGRDPVQPNNRGNQQQS